MAALRLLLLPQLVIVLLLQRFEAVEEKPDLQLARKLISHNCRGATNKTAFYLQVRDREGMTRRFPRSPNANTGLPIFWTTQDPYYDIIPSYDTFWSDAFTARNITADSYKWCIYVLGEDNEDIHGCIQGGRSWGTPIFQSLQLLKKLSVRDVRSEFGLDFPLMTLTIHPVEIYGIDSNLLWQNAMLTLNINWNDPTGYLSPVGEYFILDVHVERPQYLYISDISKQEDSFLIEGAINHLVCETYGVYQFHLSGWRLEGRDLPTFHAEAEQCDVNNRSIPCPDVYYYKQYFTTDNCDRGSNTGRIFIGTIRILMEFRNASRDDTGEYTCVINDLKLGDLQTRSVFLYVVFTEILQSSLDYNRPGELRCGAKAPAGSRMTVWHNGQQLVQTRDPQHTCDGSPQISVSSERLDANFSMFYAVVKICLVNWDNSGTYVCQVEYPIPTTSDPQFARTEAEVTVIETAAENLGSGQDKTRIIAVACCAVFAALLALVVIITAIKVCHLRAKRKRSRHHMTFKISPVDTLNHQKTPGVGLACMEFSRGNLEFHKQIGKGRFGKVMLATASNIVPHLPTLNKVAVKMALTKNSDEIIHNELNLMKKLSSHDNICNLLAYCTIGGPVLIILEYAEHGNLKDYLDTCRQSLRQSGQAPFISSDSVVSSVSDPFGAGLGGEGDSPGSQERPTGLITESHVRNYAFQIACGLEHLEKMEVVHCDLAARNILISEDAVLKIADFGMARSATDTRDTTSGNTSCIDLDGLVAIKWAALEVLQNKGHFFKSDVWSFAVIIWEIASYGARPFSEHKVGVSLSKFIGLLQAGHRLPQPEGLSDSLYQRLLSCWFVDLDTRPSAHDLKNYFGSK